MENYTIRPVRKLIDNCPGTHVNLPTLTKIIQQVERTQAQKQASPEQKDSAVVEREYLKILKMLSDAFGSDRRLAKAHIVELVDKYIREHNLYYQPVRHKIKHSNTFYNEDESEQLYDVAFYNSHADNHHPGHHRHAGMNDIFYARFERTADTVLIGNLQIDDNLTKHPWKDLTRERIMLARKNLYQNMIQEALKQAIQTKKSKIMFQTGDAALIAQQGHPNEEWVTVEMENETYEEYCSRYEAMHHAFAAIEVGDNSIIPHQYRGYGVVIEKHEDYYRSYHDASEFGTGTLMAIIKRHWNSGVGLLRRFEYNKLCYALTWDVRNQKAHSLLKALNGIITMVDPDYVEHERAAKLKYLKAELKKIPAPESIDRARRPEYEIIDKFLIKFNYHKVFLAQHPEVKTIELPPAMQKKYHCGGVRFYDPQQEANIIKFNKKQIERPELGKSYVMHKRDLDKPLIKHKKVREKMETVYYFYEKILPELFGRLGLEFKKVPIECDYGEEPLKSTAWLITAGLEKLQTEPLVSFAHGATLKADCEVLPRLTAVMKKFGLAPEKLSILNDWLAANCLGAYNAAGDEITLSTPSLSLAAHEGLHRLIKKGLVPPREYRAMIKAGQRLAAKNPASWQKRQPPRSRPPVPPAEEYAAWFVERYYEDSPTARKYLMGAKVPVFERVMGYVKEGWDIIAARLGNNPARARQFLRRVERQQIIFSTERSPRQSKKARDRTRNQNIFPEH